MPGTNQELKKTEGAAMASRGLPDDVRLTLLATVTGRLIEMRRQGYSAESEYELSRLVPAIEWLTNDAEGGTSAKH